MRILGFYKDLTLSKKEENYYVVNTRDKKILFKGDEDQASKYFIMLVANFINENRTRV